MRIVAYITIAICHDATIVSCRDYRLRIRILVQRVRVFVVGSYWFILLLRILNGRLRQYIFVFTGRWRRRRVSDTG
jgi:hypothetical protein